MRFLFRWGFRLFLVLVVLGVAALLLKDPILKSIAERRVRDQTGMDVSIQEFHVNLLSPVFTMHGFKLFNPPEFGGNVFLNIPEVFLDYDPLALGGGTFRCKRLRFHLAEVNLVKHQSGKMNYEVLFERAQTSGKTNRADRTGDRQMQFGGIDTLHLTLEKVRYTDLKHPAKSREFNLGVKNEEVKNLRNEEDVNRWLANFLARVLIQEYFKGSTSSAPAVKR